MSRQARVGLFVMAGLALFLLGLFAIANRSFLFSDTVFLRSQFTRVAGLQSGSAVQYQGVNVGRVESVRLPEVPNGKITVTMAISENAQHLISTKTQALIKSDGLVGSQIIVLVNQPGQGQPVGPDDYITGVDPFDLFEITDKALVSVQSFEQAARSFEQIMKDVRQGQGTLGRIVYDPSLYESIVQTTDESRRVLGNLADDAEALVALAGEATQGVQSILQKVDQGDGTIPRLINDPSVFNSLLASADTLQAVARDLNAVTSNAENITNWGALGAYRFAELMEAAKHNWLFKRYFEERGYLEQASFEVRERALEETYKRQSSRELELLEWENRLQALEAAIEAGTLPQPAPNTEKPEANEDASDAQEDAGDAQEDAGTGEGTGTGQDAGTGAEGNAESVEDHAESAESTAESAPEVSKKPKAIPPPHGA